MDFKIEDYLEATHYDQVMTWFIGHKWQPLPKQALPEIGVVISSPDGKVGICAGFLYRTDSAIAMLEWVVSNPEYSEKEERSQALDLLLEQILCRATDNGYKLVYAFLGNERLIKRYTDAGFEVGDANVTTVVWGIGGF